MSIHVRCEACGKELRARDETAGRRAKCPNCQATIQIPFVEVHEDEAEESATLSSSTTGEFGDDDQPCPACGEMNASTARQCRHCDEDLEEAEYDEPRRSRRFSRRAEGAYPTADLGKRLLGSILDVFAGGLAVLPGVVLIIVAIAANDGRGNEQIGVVGILVMVLGVLIACALNLYLLVTRSQTIGKWLINTKIMDYETHEPAGFVKSFVLRGLVNGMVGAFVPFYGLVDVCFIFGEERRCLHDLIAGTYVVDIS